MKIEWSKPTYFNIKWDNGPNMPASPLQEISKDEFLRLFHCGPWGLDGLNFGGSAPLPDTDKNSVGMYSWHYYFFHRYALAVAERYTCQSKALGDFLSDGYKDSGYDVKFYRLGCQHPNLKSEWPRMHERQDGCLDCGFTAMYDTSG